jgi:hypothetical protein
VRGKKEQEKNDANEKMDKRGNVYGSDQFYGSGHGDIRLCQLSG